MTLYTVTPLECVLDGILQSPAATVEISYQGVSMQVEPVSPGIGKIVRLLHCQLEDYLNPAYAPGSLIAYVRAEKD